MASTLTTFTAFIKRRYTDQKVVSMIGTDRPTLGMMKKAEDLDGESLTVPILTLNAQGVAGSTRAVSQTNKTNVQGQKFTVTLGEYFGTTSIGDKALKASRRNVAAFLENKKSEMDSLYDQMADSLSTYLFGNGGGALGQISSISSDIITLTKPTDAHNFEVGMEIVASEGDGSDTGHSLQAGNSTVTLVNRATGAITITASELTDEDADDYLFRQGDFFGDTGVVVLKGLQAQLPGSATPGALYGMTRTSDPIRLAGCYVPSADITGFDIEKRLQTLGSYMAGRYRSRVPKFWVMHPEDWQSLSYGLQSRGQRSLTESRTSFGYEYLELMAGGRRCELYADSFCPKGKAFALNLDHWWMGSLGKLIHPIQEDGLMLLRSSTTDDYEYRLKSYPALYTNAPIRSGVVSLT